MKHVDEDFNGLAKQLKKTSLMHDRLKGVFKDFQEKLKSISTAESYKIKEINFKIIDDENFSVLFINREYQLAFSSMKDGSDTLKGKIIFYRVKSSELKNVDSIYFNDSGFVEEYSNYADSDGLDLKIDHHCVNLFLHWLYKEIY